MPAPSFELFFNMSVHQEFIEVHKLLVLSSS